eukprot:3444058-Amphidinium_carterae.1
MSDKSVYTYVLWGPKLKQNVLYVLRLVCVVAHPLSCKLCWLHRTSDASWCEARGPRATSFKYYQRRHPLPVQTPSELVLRGLHADCA